MSVSENIRFYVSQHVSPDQASVPEFCQKWDDIGGEVYWRMSTGMRTFIKPEAAIICPTGYDVVRAYIHYIPEYEMIEFSKVTVFNKGRHKSGEHYEWCYYDRRIFLAKGDYRPYDCEGNLLWPECDDGITNGELMRYLTELQWFFNTEDFNPQWEELRKYCGYRTDPEDFANNYYKYISKMKEYSAFPSPKLSASEIIEMCLATKHIIPDRGLVLRANAYFEVIDEDCAVLRCFCPVRGKFRELYEYQRVYVTGNGKVSVFRKYCGNLVSDMNPNDEILLLNPDECLNWKCIHYVSDMAGRHGNVNYSILFRLLQYPVLEKLHKSGYIHVAKYLEKGEYYQLAFNDMFGGYGDIDGTLLSSTGCSGNMLSVIEENPSTLGRNRIILNIFSDVFGDAYKSFSKEQIRRYYYTFGLIAVTVYERNWVMGMFGSNALTEEKKKFLKRLSAMPKDEICGLINAFYDSVSMSERFNNEMDDDCIRSLRSAESIYRVHDELCTRYNGFEDSKAGSAYESFVTLQEGRKKRYNYEDDEFIIRVPENVGEIVQEGIRLNHCVGSYADRHAHGKTDIIFLRKKSEPARPFYTIEVVNGAVTQIHGLNNRWLGCHPEAIPFVYEWLYITGIACDESILLNTSHVYRGNGAKMLDRDYLFRQQPA